MLTLFHTNELHCWQHFLPLRTDVIVHTAMMFTQPSTRFHSQFKLLLFHLLHSRLETLIVSTRHTAS
jgi:hypothetical protein